MFCTNCGKEIQADSNFCENCGAAVSRQPMPELVTAQVKAPTEVQAENSTSSTPKSKPIGDTLGCFIILAIFAGIVLFLANAFDIISFGNGRDIEAAEKKVISFVTENYGEIPTVHGEVLKKVDGHVLVTVTFEVEMDGYTLDGSYILDVRGNHSVFKCSKELPVDYDYKANLDEIMALWGI